MARWKWKTLLFVEGKMLPLQVWIQRKRNVILVPLDGGVADMAKNAVQDTVLVVVAGEAMVVKNML